MANVVTAPSIKDCAPSIRQMRPSDVRQPFEISVDTPILTGMDTYSPSSVIFDHLRCVISSKPLDLALVDVRSDGAKQKSTRSSERGSMAMAYI